MNATATHRRQRGFTLIEVLVAMIVIAIGLLGIAKIQALSFASTGNASMRSLAALEASSLAGSMHADRAYWAGGTAATGAGITVTGTGTGTYTISDANLAAAATCTTATATPPDCAPLTLAAFDLQQWAASLTTLLPFPVSNIICTNVAGVPVTCTITITWSENTVAVNNQGTAGGLQAPTYVLYVEP
ncbi:MAG TPA: type IV pilus modification protein PilV [Steroidobacteraceae bacterium]|nr:type IV pilus modification protein PilV [Steroidobacteraceae bacterium]